MNVSTRPATPDDVPFLREMLFEAAGPEPGEPAQTLAQVLAEPIPASYIEAWGRDGDLGVIAEAEGRAVGAAWCRLPGEVHGWGYVADDVPELAMAVDEGWRGHGVGRALLAALIDAAADAGFPALSLSVMPTDQVAMALYAGAGFHKVGTHQDLWVMRRSRA